MSFRPPFCPNRLCGYNRLPVAGFARRRGSFLSGVTGRRVARFVCSSCRRSFSTSTFRYSYRQKKPRLDAPLVRLLCSGVSLRGSARLLGINHKTVHRKLHRLARHCRRLQRLALSRTIRGHFQLDELETFESNRYQPVSVPLLIEKSSYFILSTATAPLRRKGRMTPLQKRRRTQHETLHGRRPSRSDAAVRRCLAALARHAGGPLNLDTDRKHSYRRIAKTMLGARLRHRTHDATARRDRSNPLFPINHTNAMVRYCLARLRRRSWCVTRRRAWLQKALDVYSAWFNYCRGITIRTSTTPAQAMGLAHGRLSPQQLLSWRQDWHNAGRILPPGLRFHDHPA